MSTMLAAFLDRLQPASEAAAGAAGVFDDTPITLTSQLRASRLHWQASALIAIHLLETLVLLASWACIGYGALSGRLDAGWLAAWALALGTSVPLRAAATWLQGVVAIGFGGVLKQQLLIGALAMDSDLIRAKGTGELMSEVLESESIDGLGASGGIATVLALLELLVAPFLFLWGAGVAAEIGVIIGWALLAGVLFVRDLRVRTDWTRQRASLTDRLVENMTAHRTRSMQQSAANWHDEDDAALERYLVTSRRLDQGVARIKALIPSGYVIVSIAALAPAFLTGSATLAQLAITFGSILFAASSFERLCFGYSQGAAAWIGWKICEPILKAAAHAPLAAVIDVRDKLSKSVVQARGVSFCHEHRRESVLADCSFSIERGDQILLEGASGSGKSTLAAILAGSRAPSEGYVLAGGLDRHTLGDAAWRRRIALAPQYHENHIVCGTLIFNLLLARVFPYSQDDVEEARAVCRELGLGEMIERMPAGLHQLVGDTGWRLSQGERSRIYLARALLQKADVVVLDESLAALDPENLRQSLECVMRRSPTLIVIAHP
ncbi:MAG TPA: ATP-binding cassette domain-containing protein [Steroidobacteraceae bacterium]